MQQDVIMDCLDDPDISIRLQALDLVSGMVTTENLQLVVNRLITQLQTSPIVAEDQTPHSPLLAELTPSADIEGDDPEERLRPAEKKSKLTLTLPNHYRNEVLHRILDICARDTYSAILDFEWYVEVLVQLVRLVPPPISTKQNGRRERMAQNDSMEAKGNVASRIGSELRNIAVRVKSVRADATRAAESLILIDNRGTLFPAASAVGTSILEPISWVIGEYAEYLTFPDRTLTSLIHVSNLSLPAQILSSYLQAIPKLFVYLSSNGYDWGPSRQSEVSLLLARIISFLEQLASSPDLEVQERAIEFLELLRLTADAVSSNDARNTGIPLLLSSAIPSLFSGLDLNPVAAGAQKKVPSPENLDLDMPLNTNLVEVLKDSENDWLNSSDQDEFRKFYYVPEVPMGRNQAVKEAQVPNVQQSMSYQNESEDLIENTVAVTGKRAERRERNKDDPFYIGVDDGSSGASTPFHQVLRSANGEELDIDSIPIIDLAIENNKQHRCGTPNGQRQKPRFRPKKVEIIADETIDVDDLPSGESKSRNLTKASRVKRSLLEVDSSGIGHISLDELKPQPNMHDAAIKEKEESEMANAMAEIERLRLEMQRASERIQAAQGVPPEGKLVKRKKKKKSASSKGQSYKDDGLTMARLPGNKIHGEGTTAEIEGIEGGEVGKKKKKTSKKAAVAGP
jgi:AP-3 complex subunit delta-1